MPLATDAEVGAVSQAGARSPVAQLGWLLPALVLALFGLKPLGPLKDPDAFWHVVAGKHLLESGQFVLNDPFGAATQKQWILNQWLPEVLMHWMDAAYGLPGVAWLLCLGSLLVGLSVLTACRRRSSPLVSALVLALTFVALSGSLSPRPQLVTFALAAVTTSAWLLTRSDGRVRWWLVPMTWVWACSHGMWFVGPVIGSLVVLGMLLEGRATMARAAQLALVPVLSVVAAGLTPVGPRLYSSPFQVGGVTAYISEWQRPGLGDPAMLAALALVLPVVLRLLRSARRSWVTVLLTALALMLVMTWSRTVGLGAVILAPLTAEAVRELMGQRVPGVLRRERAAAAVAGLGSLFAAAVLVPTVAAAPAIGPNGLNASLSGLPTGSVVCNDQADGGWLMLQHPELRPTMDTRVELYSVEHIEAYLHFMAGGAGWQVYPDRLGCSYAVLPVDAAVVPVMQATGEWSVVEQNLGYVLLRSSR